ncbi:hypothetical protein NE237_016237 [Protea cynaroides]|uniref:Uncharacterized protein n=1 Tax=Protea cynaroides TaxID=273540 RepID=A0A9Q0KFH5_9MAGN|nr:hypothetical protein NE237_016237 [Protea cynaroides]
MEFFSAQTPKGLKTLGNTLSMSSASFGSYLCSFLLIVVMAINSLPMLLSTKLVRLTLLLWVVVFGNAFTYYALVLLTSKLNSSGTKCTQTTLHSGNFWNADICPPATVISVLRRLYLWQNLEDKVLVYGDGNAKVKIVTVMIHATPDPLPWCGIGCLRVGRINLENG